ncbi:hypothetical protein GQ457_09G021350 [Hibiscus cannabinus]
MCNARDLGPDVTGLRGGENRLSGLLEGVSIASSGRQGSKGDRVKPLFKYGFCEYGSVNKQWGGYALFGERISFILAHFVSLIEFQFDKLSPVFVFEKLK